MRMKPETEISESQLANQEDEIDLMAIWQVIVKQKKMILTSMLVAALASVAISLSLPNIYRAEVLLSPVSGMDSKSGLGSALGNMGGLAAMAGLSLGGSSSEESVAVLQSREFLWQFVQKYHLMPILFEDDWDAAKKRWKDDDPKEQPNQWDVYRLFITKKNRLDVAVDKKTDLVTVAVEWKDPVLAAAWANGIVNELNRYLAKQAIERSERNLKYLNDELARTQIEEMRQVLFDMIASEQKNAMTANTQKEFAFKVLDPAAEPDKKVKPTRSLIVLLSVILTGLVAVGVALVKEGKAKRAC